MLEKPEQRDKYPTLNKYTNPVKRPERAIVGREKEIQKIQAAMMRPEISNVMLLAPAGSGKALADDTPIPVNDDRLFAPIGSLKPGDTVFDELGEPTTVLGVFPQGTITAYEVTLSSGAKVVCNTEHIWAVQTDSEYAKLGADYYTSRTLGEMLKMKGERFRIPRACGIHRPASNFVPCEAFKDFASRILETGYLPATAFSCTLDQRKWLLDELFNKTLERTHEPVELHCGHWHDDSYDADVFGVQLVRLAESVGYEAYYLDGVLTVTSHPEPFIRIVNIRRLPKKMPMTCIYVASRSHLFQCSNRYIVTHNTALVQGTMMADSKRIYLEVDLARMIADVTTDVNQMAAMLKTLFDETAQFHTEEHAEIVLFIDEFHQVVQLSPAAVEALKPLLADSGTRGIKVIAATTFAEFIQYISPNQPLVERLQRINLPEPDKKMVCAILRGMARRYGVEDQFPDDSMFELIYEYTNRYIPSNAQPRKSILILDAMVGWHRLNNVPIDLKLLAEMIYQQEGVNVAFRVDASTIRKRLDERVLSQKFATKTIEDYLQVCVADLNDKDRPMGRLLFSGSTGTGKTETTKALADILFDDQRALVRFDMSEFANADSLERFRKELTDRVWQRPFCILLLDEIEKACAECTRLLLQVLDDARLTNSNGREVSFKNCYIIMTTNAGSEAYKIIAQYNVDDEGSGKSMQRYHKLIRESLVTTTGGNRFPPELLGRVDAIVPFQPLSEQTQILITRKKLMSLKAKIKQIHGIETRISPDVIDYLVKDKLDTDSDSGGARAIITRLETDVTAVIARFINENPGVKAIAVDVAGDMAFKNKNQLQSSAYIKVRAINRPK